MLPTERGCGKMKPGILSFGLDCGEVAVLERLCAQLDMNLRQVRTEEYGNPVGALAGLMPVTVGQGQAPLAEKMLVFAFVPDFLLQYLLEEIRKAGIAQGSYKAVLTEHNVAWTPHELFEELRREREELESE